MNGKTNLANRILVILLGALLLSGSILRAIYPAAILPRLDIPAMALLSLISLLAEYFIDPDAACSGFGGAVLTFFSFALLPWASGMARFVDVLQYGWIGGIVFAVTGFLFVSLKERISILRYRRLAASMNAVLLFLAAQGFSGILI